MANEKRQNARRLRRIETALESGLYSDPYDRQTGAVDMLADLMHYCQLIHVDFDDALRIARTHFEVES